MRNDLASTSTAHPHLPRLVLGELLGRGTLTEVRRARDRVLDRPVAVKIFDSFVDPLARDRFDTEAYMLARLSHPGLVSIFNVGSLDERPYLVMQLIDGESLATRLRTGPLPVPTVVAAGAALADALAHAHTRGVVHHAVTTSAILLDRHNSPHLTDFGVARRYRGRADASVDVRALGLVLLECLTGETDFNDTARAALAQLPDPLADLLARMTVADPGKRPSAVQCAQRLRALRPAGPDEPAPRRARNLIGATRVIPRPRAPERSPAPAAPVAPRARARGKSIARSPLAIAAVGTAAAIAAVLLVMSAQHPTTRARSATPMTTRPTSQHLSATTEASAQAPVGTPGHAASPPHAAPPAGPGTGDQPAAGNRPVAGGPQARGPAHGSAPRPPANTPFTTTPPPTPVSTSTQPSEPSTPEPTPIPTTGPSSPPIATS